MQKINTLTNIIDQDNEAICWALLMQIRGHVFKIFLHNNKK